MSSCLLNVLVTFCTNVKFANKCGDREKYCALYQSSVLLHLKLEFTESYNVEHKIFVLETLSILVLYN